jgi:cobalt-zinc-cadmium efflux system outer membrane protein
MTVHVPTPGSGANASRALCSLLIPIAGVGIWGGCTLNRVADQEVCAAVQNYERCAGETAARFAGSAVRPAGTRPAATQPAATRPASAPVGMETLREYILTALRENPDIQAASATAAAQAARVPQATALPDPVLNTRTLPEPLRTAEGDNFFTLAVQQKLLVPGKLIHAGRAEVEQTRMALAELERTVLRVIADVKRAYYRLYITDESASILEANQDVLRSLIEVARAQVAAGRRSQVDVLRAQVELSNLASRLIELTQERQTVVAQLNRLMNRPPLTPVPPPRAFSPELAGLELDRLLSLAAEANPELARLRQQLARDRERVKLAELAFWPDFTLGAEWIQMSPRTPFVPPPNPQTGIVPPYSKLSEAGSDNWAIVFGLNLPIWYEKICGGIREARQRLLATQSEYVSAHNRVQFEIEDALARVRAQQELAGLFATTIIPEAQQAYEVSLVSYEAGQTDFLFVIDNWQKWLTYTIQLQRALGDLERSVADLEQSLGMSLAQIEPTE